ncbi:MAG: electron transfer flavoprotein subunit alpha/FixB family protein [Candidatus Solibacter usitatus]|nr:electron transfer flavoprotein subunit alpha/FixB family protein [Candidatus Solibacter usitatus]
MSILVVMEQRAGAWNKMSWETLAAAQQIGAELNQPVEAAVLGQDISGLAAEMAGKKLAAVHAVTHELLKNYTPDGYAAALRQLIARRNSRLVIFPHTYQVRDFAPKLATSLNRVLVSDVVSHRIQDGQPVMVRQLFQGKISVDVSFLGDPPHFASLQAGAYRADKVEAGSAAVETFAPDLNAGQIRTQPLELFRESQRAVDLGAAEIIVSVGRGIKEAENIPIVQQLADVLGAELAASRPICDSGWSLIEEIQKAKG